MLKYGTVTIFLECIQEHKQTNSNYSSISADKSKTLSPKDDIESLVFLLAECLVGRLPWSGIKDKSEVIKLKQLFLDSNAQPIKHLVRPQMFLILQRMIKQDEVKIDELIGLLMKMEGEQDLSFETKDLKYILWHPLFEHGAFSSSICI